LSAPEKKFDLLRRCVDCAPSHTYTKRTRNGTSYPHWYRNPYKEGTWFVASVLNIDKTTAIIRPSRPYRNP